MFKWLRDLWYGNYNPDPERMKRVFTSGRGAMFTGITIHLTGTLCACPNAKKNLGWRLLSDGSGRSGLSLQCRKCGTELRIPHNKFVANFDFDGDEDNDDGDEDIGLREGEQGPQLDMVYGRQGLQGLPGREGRQIGCTCSRCSGHQEQVDPSSGPQGRG